MIITRLSSNNRRRHRQGHIAASACDFHAFSQHTADTTLRLFAE